jgi:hypothetical protein
VYGVIVSYDAYAEREERCRIAARLWASQPPDSFDDVISLLDLSHDEVIRTALNEVEALQPVSLTLMPYVARYTTHQNVATILEFMEKVIRNPAFPVFEICNSWVTTLIAVVDFMDGRVLSDVACNLRFLRALPDLPDEDQQRTLFEGFLDNRDLAALKDDMPPALCEAVWPSAPAGMEKEELIQGLCDLYPDNAIAAIGEITLLDPPEAIEILREAIPQISGLFYSRLVCAYTLLGRLDSGRDFSKELAILDILATTDNHRMGFHSLIQDPLETLLAHANCENLKALAPLSDLLGISHDKVVLHVMLHHIHSDRFEEYEAFVPELRAHESLEHMADLLHKKLPSVARATLYGRVGRHEDSRRQLTLHCLQKCGLSELGKQEMLDNPERLVTELYTRVSYHESFGARVHDLADRIAEQWNLPVDAIRADLIRRRLCENERPTISEESWIFCETVESVARRTDTATIQQCLFILRAWDPSDGVEWLIDFVNSPNEYRAKARAVTCLWALADEALIQSSMDFCQLSSLEREVYIGSNLELFDIEFDITQFAPENAASTLARFSQDDGLHPVVYRLLLEIALADRIDDRLAILRLASRLLESRKRFLLRTIGQIFATFPHYAADEYFRDLYRVIVSAPLDELISRSAPARQVHASCHSVLRDLLDVVGQEPVRLETWLINGRDFSWESVVNQLCAVGYSGFAAELGSMVIDQEPRARILCNLIAMGHFDDPIQFGFDRNAIFSQIVRDGKIEQATQMLIDPHFDLFVGWLVANGDCESVEKVRMALKAQGRTLEAKKVAERLADRAKTII